MCCGHGSKQSHELISGASEEKVVAADKHPSRHSGERHQRRGEHFCSRLQPGHRASWVSLRNIKELSDQPRRQTKRVSTGQYTLHTRTLIRTHTHTHTHTHSHALTRTRTYPHTCTHKTHPHTHTHAHTHTLTVRSEEMASMNEPMSGAKARMLVSKRLMVLTRWKRSRSTKNTDPRLVAQYN